MEHQYQHQPNQPQSLYTPSYNPAHTTVQTAHAGYPVQSVQPTVVLVQNSAQQSPLKEKEECCCGCDPKHGLIIFGVLYLIAGLNNALNPAARVYCSVSSSSCHTGYIILGVCLILFGVLALAGVNAKKTELIKASLVVYSLAVVIGLYNMVLVFSTSQLVVGIVIHLLFNLLLAAWIISMGLSFMRNLENE